MAAAPLSRKDSSSVRLAEEIRLKLRAMKRRAKVTQQEDSRLFKLRTRMSICTDDIAEAIAEAEAAEVAEVAGVDDIADTAN